MDTVQRYSDDFCVVGSVCEAYEALWRIVGYENALIWTATEPDAIRDFNERLIDFMIEVGNQQIRLARVPVLIVWGDVAYRNGMMFSPRTWRELFYPGLARMCREFKRQGVKLIYHGCGDARAIYGDLIEAGIDGYNSLEVRAGLDVVQLKKQYGRRLAYNGNISVEVLERGNRDEIRAEVLRKLNAAKGGGYIFQSDHSVSSSVSGATYDYIVKLVREYGRYPLRLGEFEEVI
jgi:uroporphyrinogen decarboxylase